jgi:ATP-dependent DNA ligase
MKTNSKTTLYQKSRLDKIQEWSIWVVEKGTSGFPEVHIEHGQTDGKKQTTFDIVSEGVNIGKANETSALQQAYLMMERKATKQKEEGYVEDQKALNKTLEINWTKPLPKELCFYKPQSSIEENKLTKLKKPIFTIKRDGLMTIIRQCDEGLQVYSRRMDLVSDKFPHLTKALSKLPPKTILLGEVIFDRNGKDDFKTATSIYRSDPEVAIEKQKELGNISYYAFDLAFLDGKNLLTTTAFNDRHKLLSDLVKKLNSQWVMASEVINKNHQDALEETSKRKLEGLVIWDGDGIMDEDEAMTLSGKPYRPNVLWKSKKKLETDVIVRWDPDNGIGDYGNGKLKGLFGNGFMYQLHEDKEIFLGKVGGGLSEDDRKYYTDTKLFPRCWCIELDSFQPKSGKARFPVFNLDRTLCDDKSIEECDIDPRVLEAMESDDE